jgi:hypothetical protein
MKLAVLIALALVGVAFVTTGAALIYPPAAFILFGVACVAVALVVEVRDA